MFSDYTFEITTTFPRGQWVNISGRTQQNFQARVRGYFQHWFSGTAPAWYQKILPEGMIHVYKGENGFSVGCNQIGSASKSRQIIFHTYKVFNHHLIHEIQQNLSRLCRFYIFCWTIAPCLCNFKNWPQNSTMIYLLPCGLCQIGCSNTLQLPQSNNKCSLFGGGVSPAVLSILQAMYFNGSLSVAFSFVRLHVCRIGSGMCLCQCVLK